MDKNLIELIIDKAKEANIDPSYLLAMAKIESNFNPNARNPSGAKGLYQFMPSTAKHYKLTNPFDAEASINAVIKFTKDNASYLKSKGVSPFGSNLYLTHQQGIGGAVEIIKAAASNTEVSKTVRRNMNVNGGIGKTPREFLKLWADKYQKAILDIAQYLPE